MRGREVESTKHQNLKENILKEEQAMQLYNVQYMSPINK